ncbi:MAG TPA: transcriptional repressor [Deltaproteobacteria bacterium]|nr:transcriptional repressor [Deltaproteobacteria bacterium]
MRRNELVLMKMSDLEGKLRQKDLKITPQRLEILRAVQRHQCDHPSAELIYQTVKKRYPAVSLATVYKTLDTLVEIGEIRAAVVSQGRTRYDTRLDRHHHFLCSRCGHVQDVEMRLNCLETCTPESLPGKGTIERSEVVFYGICSACEAATAAHEAEIHEMQ